MELMTFGIAILSLAIAFAVNNLNSKALLISDQLMERLQQLEEANEEAFALEMEKGFEAINEKLDNIEKTFDRLLSKEAALKAKCDKEFKTPGAMTTREFINYVENEYNKNTI